ncbi:PepSY domain-containing protein [Hyphomicrobium sp. 2TAF46]|uniref:PepSY domain-containing protein n=1 Tax=Hyphomicrobium sp. 2TAF46 TaxID=3233019 RepID=UPI003F8F57DA
MLKAWTLRLHRWLALIFALPLMIVFLTGLILSFEPAIVASTLKPNVVDAAQIEAALAKHDPDGALDRIFVHAPLGTLVLGDRGGPEIDLATGEQASQRSTMLAVYVLARRIHKTLLLDGEWGVTISTIAMLALAVIGIVMGTRPLRNTISGWHTAAAWTALPLVLIAPLTGLAMLYKVTFSGPEPLMAANAAPRSIVEALRIVARERDLATLLTLRLRKNGAEARFIEDGEYSNYAVSTGGLVAKPRNWPKLLHEGNWAGVWSASANAVTSLVLILLLSTGLFIWARRRLRRRRRVMA